MTQEERQLLLRDICMRLPHGVNVYCEWNYLDGERGNDSGILLDIDLLKDTILFKRSSGNCTRIPFNRIDGVVKPYLRPMSSMTEEEYNEYQELYDYEECSYNQGCEFYDEWKVEINDEERLFKITDWLNAHHFDWHGLIKKGLALETPEGMYKTN